jgi:hypothetical protein
MDNLNDELQNFDTLPVAFLLQGKNEPFTFNIPSFQRGYRWEDKHVKDMLDDLYEFAKTDDGSKTYFLQPLVVRKTNDKNVWEVLDGQQRLTTMLLILRQLNNRILPEDKKGYHLYDIKYIERESPNFEELDGINNLDCFYLKKAQCVINNWYEEKKDEKKILDKMMQALYYPDNDKKVKFIWYVVSDETSEQAQDDLIAIKVFNRLNKGKISLTSSELIKALFYIKFKQGNTLDVDRFSMEWDSMEKQFEKDDFWYFISDRKEDIGTRLDVLFDYVANVNYRTASDSLDSYRYFQDKYNQSALNEAWEDVKKAYDMFLRWYEDIRIYNYVGFLVWERKLPQEIKKHIYAEDVQKNEDELIASIQELIKEIVDYAQYCKKTMRDIDSFEYSTDLRKIRELLLLFNIETYNTSKMKFPFDSFQKDKWDVEHIDSQKDNNMQELEHKMDWIKLVCNQLEYQKNDDTYANNLFNEGENLLRKFEEEKQDTNDAFKDYYSNIYKYYNETADVIEKDTIDNLTLLNCGINRSYKNAPFSCKRSIIIQNDSTGVFIPLCTRNLFLKYYTGALRGASQLNMIRWNETDRTAYKKQLVKTLKKYLS